MPNSTIRSSRRVRETDADPQTIAVDDLASYIADISGELALLAGRARWPLLTYFLNMARVEAEARMALDRNAVPTLPVRRPATRARKRA